jgi:hypothetical protein
MPAEIAIVGAAQSLRRESPQLLAGTQIERQQLTFISSFRTNEDIIAGDGWGNIDTNQWEIPPLGAAAEIERTQNVLRFHEHHTASDRQRRSGADIVGEMYLAPLL